MAKALFISQEYLTEKTSINSFVDASMVVPFIGLAQDSRLLEELGRSVVNDLENGVINSNLTADEIELLSYVQPCVAWWSLIRAIPFIGDRVRNTGVVKNNSASIQNIEDKAQGRLMDMAESYAGWYTKQMRVYLCANKSKFPGWTPFVGPAYNVGIHLWSEFQEKCDPCDC